jgi:glycosyltransferase involved in cell wall biosynthesis
LSKKARPRILVVIGNLEVGGAEMDLLRNLPAIDRSRFEVMVYTFNAPGRLAPQMAAAGVPVYQHPGLRLHASSLPMQNPERPLRPADSPLPNGNSHATTLEANQTAPLPGIILRYLRRAKLLRQYVLIIFSLRRFIVQNKINVVHCILPNAYLFGTLAGVLAGRRDIVMSRVSLNQYQHQSPFFYRIERNLLHKLVRVAVGNARAILQELHDEGLAEHKLFLLYNGIAPEQYAPSPERRTNARAALGIPAETLVITAIGNLYPYKGHADLINGLAGVADAMPRPWRLLIAGGDRVCHEAALRALIAKLSLNSDVTLLGHRNDVPEILAASDLLAMPSHQEGLPNAILEAMASGLPIVATRVGGIPELIVDGQNGTLIAPHDISALGRAILELAVDPVRRRDIGARNLARVRASFSLERSVAGFETLYGMLTRSAGVC